MCLFVAGVRADCPLVSADVHLPESAFFFYTMDSHMVLLITVASSACVNTLTWMSLMKDRYRFVDDNKLIIDFHPHSQKYAELLFGRE